MQGSLCPQCARAWSLLAVCVPGSLCPQCGNEQEHLLLRGHISCLKTRVLQTGLRLYLDLGVGVITQVALHLRVGQGAPSASLAHVR